MKKFIDDPRLIFKCCSLYYDDQLSQQDISEYLGVSRPSVSRMLKLGKEQGFVKIEVTNPYNIKFGKLERELEKRYGLREAAIAEPSPAETANERISLNVSKETVNFLIRTLEDGDVVGVSMGMTLQNVLRAARQLEEPIRCKFVPILGGIGASRLDIHSNYIASEFARLFGGDCAQFFSPAIFSDVNVLEGFLKEESVQSVLRLYRSISTIIMGIGIPQRGGSTLMETGYVSGETLDKFVEAGAVGDILLQFYDQDGQCEQFMSFNRRVAGMPFKQLKKVQKRIGIAGGAVKALAVRGAIRGGFINTLVTDFDCATALLAL
ncbi:sugar-binding transcriptional regulator [Propionispora hippei]|uniref:DNA-binding transcriptional regulator LsrR, DeoR family n=1 Tax=Propionispora hippei DSM 15287 TaxID=1123003 RepID=A0A1M6EZ58_9FIRM|nr:sugar-binding domain-containing protein [Propionispora hippei]SHI90722.1 DNA-binding transcriptional regulator LsrR, DeoR family [Propionispora hippei DSM 15287]